MVIFKDLAIHLAMRPCMLHTKNPGSVRRETNILNTAIGTGETPNQSLRGI